MSGLVPIIRCHVLSVLKYLCLYCYLHIRLQLTSCHELFANFSRPYTSRLALEFPQTLYFKARISNFPRPYTSRLALEIFSDPLLQDLHCKFNTIVMMSSDESENEEMKQELKSQLVSALTKDLSASDCLVALFWSALTNYRHDTVLRPFPQMFLLKDGNKDVDGMRALFKDIPTLNKIRQHPDSINKTILKLLQWIICTKSFTLSSKLASEFSVIENQTPGSSHSTKPHCFFELNYATELEEKWNKLVGNYGTFLAYHGSRVENFHCIAHIGLLSHMNKTGVFGEGTYLSTDLGVCMNFSPTANTWPKSSLPPLCSMVAVCEVINHPEIRSRVQVGGEPTLNQKIPERYFVVTNDELIRIKYILVFAHERSRSRSTQRWLVNHKWTIIVIFYVLLLVFLGLWQSRYFSKLYYQYSRKYISL